MAEIKLSLLFQHNIYSRAGVGKIINQTHLICLISFLLVFYGLMLDVHSTWITTFDAT